MDDEKIIGSVRQWVKMLVVDMNLCPFAKRELIKNRVRFVATEATTEDQLLTALRAELELLMADRSVETTLLIHPGVLQDFFDYNRFLTSADRLLVRMKLEGVYQIASFHPDYQFAGTASDDAENYTNRSPYPMLHIIREDSLERVIADYPDVDQIPARNIALMKDLGRDRLQALVQACLDGNGEIDRWGRHARGEKDAQPVGEARLTERRPPATRVLRCIDEGCGPSTRDGRISRRKEYDE